MTDDFSTLAIMKQARRWLLADTNKVPHYVNGTRRNGPLDSPEDVEQLASYDQACAALEDRDGWLLGFALGPDGAGGNWQGIDLDKVASNGLADLADALPGCVEVSPSGEGAHALGYGRPFTALGSNGTGIEAYSTGRYFTVTEHPIRDTGLLCLADHVEQVLLPRHHAGRAATIAIDGAVSVDPKTVKELRSALFHMRSDDYDLWVRMGLALKELGDAGRGLWLNWSATSEKFDPKKAAKKWDGLVPRDTGYQTVFAEAQRQGWVNPASNLAQPSSSLIEQPSSSVVTLEYATANDTATNKLEFLLDPFLPAKCVVGAFGRGSTAKSSFYASAAAHISSIASTLWVSVEEPADWIKVRHIKSGGLEGTLAVVKAVANKRDTQGRVIASSFDVYEHLELAIIEAQAGFSMAQLPPLRLVQLDTAVGLTSWGKGESPNDDAAVKKLLGFLQALAERYDLTIVVIGHANKGKHDHFADKVMGASAWTNSPRLSFMHAADQREDYAFVVRTAKTNFDAFGVPYSTEPVHTLYSREHGPDTVLVRVVPGAIIWGDAASIEMFNDATKRPHGDGDGGTWEDRRKGVDVYALEVLAEMVQALDPGQHLTRDDVEERVGRPIDRRRWVKIDQHLHSHPFVEIERGEKNRRLYKRKAVVQEPPP